MEKKETKKIKELLALAVSAAGDKKGEDIVVLDVRKLSNFCDYFILCTAESSRRLATIAESVIDAFKKEGVRLFTGLARQDSDWVLLDFSDIVMHIFTPQAREYYHIERLWKEAKTIHV